MRSRKKTKKKQTQKGIPYETFLRVLLLRQRLFLIEKDCGPHVHTRGDQYHIGDRAVGP